VILADVLSELLAAAATTGVRIPPQLGDKPAGSPMAIVELPDTILFDKGGRFDRYPDVRLVLMCGPPTAPTSWRALTPYADGTGPKSMKAALEAHPYTACSTVRVASAEPDVVSYSGVDQLAIVFHIDVTGGRQ
jgi:hypothetical protein